MNNIRRLEILQQRHSNLRSILDIQNLDSMILCSQAAINYVTDTIDVPGFLIINRQQLLFFSDSRFTIEIEQMPISICAKIYTGNIWRYLKDNNHIPKGRTGTEYAFCTGEQIEQISSQCGRKNLFNISEAVRKLFNFHDELSLYKYKKAVQITKNALQRIKEFLVPGVTELEIAARISFFMRLSGAGKDAFPPIVAFGENSALPHAIPSNKKLKKNDIALIDFGCYYQGIYTDVTRTFAVGNKQSGLFSEAKSIINHVVLEISKILSAGKSTYELDNFAREILSAKTYNAISFDKYFIHALGHGVGYEIHAYPTLSKQQNIELIPGNIITIEPGVYFKGLFGYRHEDMYLILENSVKKITNIDV